MMSNVQRPTSNVPLVGTARCPRRERAARVPLAFPSSTLDLALGPWIHRHVAAAEKPAGRAPHRAPGQQKKTNHGFTRMNTDMKSNRGDAETRRGSDANRANFAKGMTAADRRSLSALFAFFVAIASPRSASPRLRGKKAIAPPFVSIGVHSWLKTILLILLILSKVSSHGDIVTGHVQRVTAQWNTNTPVIFTPTNTPVNINGVFINSDEVRVYPNTNGYFSNRLAGPIAYRVRVGTAQSRDVMSIYTLGNGGTFDWLSLTTNSSIASTATLAFIARNSGTGITPTFIGAARIPAVVVSNMLIATNWTVATNVTTIFVDVTLSNIVVTLLTNTALLDGQTWRFAVVKGTNLLDLRPLRPGFDRIGFGTNLTLAYGESATVEKIGTNFFCSTSSAGGPVGTVTSWFNNLAGVPKLSSLWKICDGTAVNDSGSPLNGVTTPMLTDGRFIKYFTTAGGVYDNLGYGLQLADINYDGATQFFVTPFQSPGGPSEPSNISAIPIMRIK